ncbi:flagellar export chaperone FliS [Niveibacterium umoris]|uniref:Flagellar secretion chaperone FliS n=1 Tax=Niveibacterium umoris TaxID=1193620 RepID=A0A840BEF9_9RHOO|nr:flagellar protein FliS [Niveibacterium umoris]
MQSPANAYSRVGLESNVAASSPHLLIVMLFDGAILNVNSAAVSITHGDVAGKGQALSKAIEIISSGLKASLDMNAGGELAQRLAALYDYMVSRLLYANLHNSEPALKEVATLLMELKGAWEAIRDHADAA